MVSFDLPTDHILNVCARVLELLFSRYVPRDFSVRIGDSLVLPSTAEIENFVIRIRDPGVLRRIILHPSSLSAGETYIEGRWDVEGDVREMFSLVDYLTERHYSVSERAQLLVCALSLRDSQLDNATCSAHFHGKLHSKSRDSSAVRFHYDLPAEFYRLWLDRNMQYSSAFFRTPEQSLDESQIEKMELICQRLKLQPGERFVDVGCGWGGLIVYAAKNYGVSATGITLSPKQADYAQNWILANGLEDRARVQVQHYEDATEGSDFDKATSIGMIEHVGKQHLGRYFDKMFAMLKPGGMFLNSGITVPATEHRFKGNPFIERYVFPDGDVVPFNQVLEQAERAGFEERGDINLREHYALALRHWSARLEASQEAIENLVGRETFRVFKLYLAGCTRSFLAGRNQVHQTLLAKPG